MYSTGESSQRLSHGVSAGWGRLVSESFWVDRNTGNQGMLMGRDGKGRQGSEEGVSSGGVRDMASLGQDGVLSVAEVEDSDNYWCEEVKSSGWSLIGTVSYSGWWQLMNWGGRYCAPA